MSSSSSDANNERNTRSTAGSSSSQQQQQSGGSANPIMDHISQNKLDTVMAVTRSFTILCTLTYILGLGSTQDRYRQALLLTAATSCLRLHQRMPPPPLNQINRQYFNNLTAEDSFHYLLFSFLFYFCKPVALVLLPCSLYALFNLARYSIRILELLGNHESLRLRISQLTTTYQKSLLQLVAVSEISLAVIVFFGLFTGTTGFMTPFGYYKFLTMRYNSSRNAHLKLVVTQIRDIIYTYTNRYRQHAN